MLLDRVSRLLLVATCLAVAAGCSGRSPVAGPSPEIAIPDTLRVRIAGQVTTVPLEEYVIGTALAEVAPVGDTPEVALGIYRIQSIIARTYAVSHLGKHREEGFDLCDSTHCQVYEPARLRTSRFAATARRAVTETRGQVLTFGQRLSEALFHADCGGHTSDAALIWGGAPVPYLTGAPDMVPSGTHRAWSFEVTREQFREALNATETTRVGSELRSVRIVDLDASGRAATIEIRGDEVRLLRGEQVRAALTRTHGPRAIRSTRFSLTTDEDLFRFDGTGYGHGAGLCQVGAMARVRRGESLPSILATYYPGTHLTRARSVSPLSAPRPRPFPGALLESP